MQTFTTTLQNEPTSNVPYVRIIFAALLQHSAQFRQSFVNIIKCTFPPPANILTMWNKSLVTWPHFMTALTSFAKHSNPKVSSNLQFNPSQFDKRFELFCELIYPSQLWIMALSKRKQHEFHQQQIFSIGDDPTEQHTAIAVSSIIQPSSTRLSSWLLQQFPNHSLQLSYSFDANVNVNILALGWVSQMLVQTPVRKQIIGLFLCWV